MKLKKSTINYCYTDNPDKVILDYLSQYPNSAVGCYDEDFDFNHLSIGQQQIVIFTKHSEYRRDEVMVLVNAYKRVA